MVLKFTKEQFKSGLQKAAGGKPFFKVEKALKEEGLGKLLHQPSVSKDQFRKAVGALRKQRVAYKQAGEVIRAVERKIAAEAKPGEKPKEKMTVAQLRAKMKEEEEKKERMRKMMAEIYQRERAREAEKGGPKPTGPAPTTSALHKPEAPKPAEEKQKVIDLSID